MNEMDEKLELIAFARDASTTAVAAVVRELIYMYDLPRLVVDVHNMIGAPLTTKDANYCVKIICDAVDQVAAELQEQLGE